MTDGAPSKLRWALDSAWTVKVSRGDEVVRAPKFMPPGWIEGGNLAESRMKILKASGWHLDRLEDGQNYLFPNAELASYALGWASDEYAALFPERAEEIGRAKENGGYYDLTDAILYSGSLARETALPSGVNLFYPRLPDAWDAGASVARNVERALNSGWVMVGLITERDLFLLPPESMAKGAAVTLNDGTIGVGTLLNLKKDGLISLRGRFGKGDKAFSGLTLPPRASRGGEWKIEDMMKEQQARWGAADIKAVVDMGRHRWIEEFPSLKEWLEGRLAYVEEFDLARFKWLIAAWGEMSDIGALDNVLRGIKGVMGEISARGKIVEASRRGMAGGEVLLVAPQIYDGKMLERSDAIVARVEGDGALTIVKAWEVSTDEGGRARAQGQMDASLEEYREGGVVLRRHDGRTVQFKKVAVLDSAGEIYVARGDGMDAALADVRERLVTELDLDLVAGKARGKFSPTRDELAEILKEKDGAGRLIEFLCGGKDAPEHPVVVGHVGSGGKISGLRVVSEKEAGDLPDVYFCLGFEYASDDSRLLSARGSNSLFLSVAWVSGQIGRDIDVAERSYLAYLLGTRAVFKGEETFAFVNALAGHLRENGIDRLCEMTRVIGRAPDWRGKMVVVGRLERSGKIFSLDVVNEEEAADLSDKFFCLFYECIDGVWHLVSAGGSNGRFLREKIDDSRDGAPVRVSNGESGLASVDAMTFGAVSLAGNLAGIARHAVERIGYILKLGHLFENVGGALNNAAARFAGWSNNSSIACASPVAGAYMSHGILGGMMHMSSPVPTVSLVIPFLL